MGGGVSKKQRNLVAILIGLDNSGKSTFLQQVKRKQSHPLTDEQVAMQVQTTPTVGYQEETFEFEGDKWRILDMSGQSKYREMWQNYSKQIDAIIFVLDSSDALRIQVNASELDLILSQQDIDGKPILFVANKSDLPNALASQSIADMLQLNQLTNRKWTVESTNSRYGVNVHQAFKWLGQNVEKSTSS